MREVTRGLYWVCDIPKYPSLWDIWKKKGLASIGWPRLDEGARRTIKTIRSYKEGDKVVAYLKHGRIGGIGTLTGVDRLDAYDPLVPEKGEHGRMVGVNWDTLPGEGYYVITPEDIPGPHMRTLKRLSHSEIVRLEKTVRNPDTWEALADLEHLVSDEKRELHPLIRDNLEALEEGLELFDSSRPLEYPMDPIGRVDILARDGEGHPIAIEAKPYRAGDEVIGQIARYIGWLKINHGNKSVRGIVVAGEFSPKTRYAAVAVEGLSLIRYSVSRGGITFNPVKVGKVKS